MLAKSLPQFILRQVQGGRELSRNQRDSRWQSLALHSPYCLPVLVVAPLPTGQLVESPCQVGHRPLSLPPGSVCCQRPSVPSWVQASLERAGRRDLGFAFVWSAACPLLQPQPSGHLHLKARPVPAATARPSASKSPAAADEGPVLAPQRPEAPRALTPLCSETPVYPCLG